MKRCSSLAPNELQLLLMWLQSNNKLLMNKLLWYRTICTSYFMHFSLVGRVELACTLSHLKAIFLAIHEDHLQDHAPVPRAPLSFPLSSQSGKPQPDIKKNNALNSMWHSSRKLEEKYNGTPNCNHSNFIKQWGIIFIVLCLVEMFADFAIIMEDDVKLVFDVVSELSESDSNAHAIKTIPVAIHHTPILADCICISLRHTNSVV